MNKLERRLRDLEKKIGCCCSGGNTPVPDVEVTVGDFNELINNDGLVPNTLYAVTGVDNSLYTLGMYAPTGGTTVYLRAITPNSFNEWAMGKFYNPVYDYGKPHAGIWHGGDPQTVDNKVAWGYCMWKNLTGNPGTQTDNWNLDNTNWLLLIDELEYNITYDLIKIENIGGVLRIVYREDVNNNKIEASISTLLNSSINTVRYFQFNKPVDYGNNFFVTSNEAKNDGVIFNLNLVYDKRFTKLTADGGIINTIPPTATVLYNDATKEAIMLEGGTTKIKYVNQYTVITFADITD